MSPIDFPNSPSIGEIFVSGGITRQWDGTTWSIVATTITGPIGSPGPTGPAGQDAPVIINIKTVVSTSYTLVLADINTLIEFESSSNTTITVPNDSSIDFPIGTNITLLKTGDPAGIVTVQAASGVVLNYTPTASLRTQWSSASLIKRDINLWVLVGDLA